MAFTRVVALMLLAAGGSALASCSSAAAPAAGADLITPAQALAVVKQTDAKAVQANASLDTALQNSFETGPAALADDASYVVYRFNKVAGLPSFTTTDSKVFVPHQTAYPVQFLASEVATGKTTGGATFRSTSVSLYLKAGAGDHWTIYYEAYSNTSGNLNKVTPPPAFALDAQGFAIGLPSSQSGLVLRPDGVAAAVARFVNDGSGIVAPGDFTSVYRNGLITGQTAETQMCSCHVAWQMTAANYPAYAYRLQDGSAFVIFAMKLITNLINGQFHSDGSGMGVLGPATSGDYNSLTVSSLEQDAAIVPAHGDITVPYAYDQQTTVTGATGTTI